MARFRSLSGMERQLIVSIFVYEESFHLKTEDEWVKSDEKPY